MEDLQSYTKPKKKKIMRLYDFVSDTLACKAIN